MENRKPLFTRRELYALLFPIVLENLLTSLMGTVDTMMVSRAGEAAVSAVSLVDSVNILMINLFSSMASGGCIVCSQYMGRQDLREAESTARQVMLSITGLASVVALGCVAFRKPLLQLLFGQVETAVMEGSLTYMWVTALSFPFLALYSAGAGVSRATGDSRLPMYISLIGNAINIGGNALLIFGFHMGVMGVALPTLVSRMVNGALMTWCLRRGRTRLKLSSLLRTRPDWQRIGLTLRIGIPSGVEGSMFQLGKLVIQSTISAMGTVALAANAITAAVEGLTSQAALGVGSALTTVVGVCMGAGRPEEARKNIRWHIKLGYVFTFSSDMLCILLMRPIVVLAGLSSEAADLAVHMNLIICLVKSVFWVPSFVPVAGMRGAGDVKFSMLASSLTMWFCRVAVTLVCARVFPEIGPMAMWIGMFSDWCVRGIVYGVRLFSGKWMRNRVLKGEGE